MKFPPSPRPLSLRAPRAKPDLRWWALLGLLVLVAHASLFGVGPVGEDFRILAESSHAVHDELGGQLDLGADLNDERSGSAGRPLAALSLGLSAWLWTSGGVWTHSALGLLRLENLALLLAVATLLARFLQRLVSPWVGNEQAAAAGQAALLMLMVHPLSVNAVASPAARGDLLGASLALCASCCFLRGRQEHRLRFVVAALPLTFMAALASEMAYLLPILLAGAEYFCARRQRPGHVRLRTALTTLVVFAALVGLDAASRLVRGDSPWPAELHASLMALTNVSELWFALLHGLTKLGVLILPVNGANGGGVGFVLATLLIVLVLKPALHAGLSAPRFWLSVLWAWLAMMILTEAARAGLQVGPSDWSAAAGLFPSVVVMAMGMALASTAVSGSRRQALPIIVACLLCTLSRSNARGWRSAAKQAAELSRQAAPLLLEGGEARRGLVIDPPGMVDLYAACPTRLAWMFDPAISGLPPWAEPLELRGLSSAAFRDLSRLSEFDDWRAQGLDIVFPLQSLQGDGEERWVAQTLRSDALDAPVVAWKNGIGGGEGRGEESASHWVSAAGTLAQFADPAALECMTLRFGAVPAAVESAPTTDHTSEAPSLYWRARGDAIRGGSLHGVWLLDGEGRTAVFDPGSDLAWLLGQRVDSLLLMGELAAASEAEVWPAPPAIPGLQEPAVDGDDWFLGRPSALHYPTAAAQENWVLSLLDLFSLEHVRIECELDSAGEWMAPGAELLSRELRSEPGSLAWGIERRLGTLVLQRADGRF